MKFDTKRFALAVAAGWAVWYAVCYFLLSVPRFRRSFGSAPAPTPPAG